MPFTFFLFFIYFEFLFLDFKKYDLQQ